MLAPRAPDQLARDAAYNPDLLLALGQRPIAETLVWPYPRFLSAENKEALRAICRRGRHQASRPQFNRAGSDYFHPRQEEQGEQESAEPDLMQKPLGQALTPAAFDSAGCR